jgi:hypothetical protein
MLRSVACVGFDLCLALGAAAPARDDEADVTSINALNSS